MLSECKYENPSHDKMHVLYNVQYALIYNVGGSNLNTVNSAVVIVW